MNLQKPIYTEQGRCQDCYKCVRHCPVKAIQVVQDTATVIADRCIYCGTCVNVCPSGAKKVRDDLTRAKQILRRRPRVVASLAPAYAAEFQGIAPSALIRALRTLGFAAVSETALGAEAVSEACTSLIVDGAAQLHISTACPTVVELVRKYLPDQVAALTPLRSPMQTHALMLKEHFGAETGVVFIGPCISKKLEGDEHPELVDAVLTFEDLRRWFDERGIDPALEPGGPEDVFRPGRAGDGGLYPVDGGMIRGMAARGAGERARLLSFSGLPVLREALDGLQGATLDRDLFLELLACEGGCINGPRASKGCGTALKCIQVLDRALPSAEEPCLARPDLAATYTADPVSEPVYTPAELTRALHRVGKLTPEDELNCGGCGYDSCRNLAAALLDGRAEASMCVSYMRKLAMNKANALIRAMPAGVVITDEHLRIIECNRRFAETLGGLTPEIFDARPGMEGADLRKVCPELLPSFTRTLASAEEVIRKDMNLEDRLIRITVFPVEPGRIVGAVIQDITEPSVQRERVIHQAQEVIRRNVSTVQQIAFLLGENAAETEMILTSIAQSFRMSPSPFGGPAPSDEPPRGL